MWQCFVIAVCLVIGFSNSQEFVSRDGTHEVLEGQDAQLGCVVENADDYVVMWLKGEDESGVLFAGDQPMGLDERFQLENPNPNTYNLTIRDVGPFDSGTYTCQISTQEILVQRHLVIVKTPPSLTIKPELPTLTLEPGDAMDLTCYPEGNPRPTITWTKTGGNLPDGAEFSEDMRLHYSSMQPEHKGEYKCTADNGVGDPAAATIQVAVHYPPRVKAKLEYVAATLGATVNLTCIYDANPAPTVKWYMNNYQISFTANGETENRKKIYMSRNVEESQDEQTLVIKDVTQDDMGQYNCKVENNLGGGEATFYISGTPDEARVTSDTPSGQGTEVMLRWSVKSPDSVEKYQIRYKAVYEDVWQEIVIPANTGDKSGDTWRSSYALKKLKPNTEYEIQVQAKNALGWGNLPSKDNFRIKTGNGQSTSQSSSKENPSKGKEETEKGKENESSETSGVGSVFFASLLLSSLSLMCVVVTRIPFL